MRDQVSHPHKTGKSVFLYILMVIFLDSEKENGKFRNRKIVFIIYCVYNIFSLEMKVNSVEKNKSFRRDKGR
jgi:hypothetical protein